MQHWGSHLRLMEVHYAYQECQQGVLEGELVAGQVLTVVVVKASVTCATLGFQSCQGSEGEAGAGGASAGLAGGTSRVSW